MKLTIKLTVLFTAMELISFVESRNYVMEELCGEMVKLDSYREHSAELVQTKRIKYQQDSNCIVRLKTESSYRFIVVFKKVDIEYEPMCDDDYLKVLDGNTTSSPTVKGLAKKICGYSKPPGSYVTTGRYITLQFRSDSWANEDGFDILLTVFREVPCTDDEFKCRNNRCIAARLQCDGSNNCGDYSDECQLSPTVILAIIASVFIVTILGIGIMLYVRNFRNGRGKKNNKTDDWSIFKTEEQIPEILRNRCPHHKTPKSTREEQGESIPKPSCSTKQEQNGVELKVENLCHGHQGNPSELSSKKSAAKC